MRTLPQLANAGCTVGTTSLAGFILELALMVRRSTGRVRELFPSCQGQRSRLPGKGSCASTKFFKESLTSAGTMRTTLTSFWFGRGPDSPRLYFQDNSFWNRSEKPRSSELSYKDANLHLTKKCGTGFQKAAQCQPYLSIETSLHI